MKFKAYIAILLPVLLGGAVAAEGHSARATMDARENAPSFTALARITCFDDGTGATDHLLARVRDNSAPVDGLYINLQLLKGRQAISISDTTPGDADYSDYIALPGGNGVYTLLLNKTNAGARQFDLEWHCMTADNQHTGTDILVDQFK